MAMCTTLQLVSKDEIATLEKSPDAIRDIDKPEGETFRTYHYAALNFFLTGSAYPSEDHALGALLCGEKNIETSALENGSFDLTTPAKVVKVAAALEKVDNAKIRARVKKADLEELREEEEVDEEHTLEESEDPAREIVTDLEGLKTFFAAAVKANKGMVIYTE